MSRSEFILCLALCGSFLRATLAAEPPPFTAQQALQMQPYVPLINEFNTLRAAGRHREALDRAQRILKQCDAVFGRRYRATLLSMERVGLCLTELGENAAARAVYQELVPLSKEVNGPMHILTGVTLVNYAVLLSNTGDYAASRANFEEALSIYKANTGLHTEDAATVLNNYALLLQRMGDYEAALPVYEQSLSIRRKLLGPRHAYVASSYSNLAVLLQKMGRVAAARPLQEEALVITQATLGLNHPSTALVLNNMGCLYNELGDYPAGRDCFEKALAIQRRVLGSKHQDTASTLNNLGYAAQLMEDYIEAKACYEESLAVQKQAFGLEHQFTALLLQNLGMFLQSTGDYEAAHRLLEEALEIDKKVLGLNNPETTRIMRNIGNMFRLEGKNAKARPYLEECLAIDKEIPGQYRDVSSDYRELAMMDAAEDKWDRSADFADQSRRMTRRHVARVLPGLSDREQIRYLQGESAKDFQFCLSLALTQRQNPNIAKLSAGWLANGKGVVQESLAAQAQVLRESKNPQVAAAIKQLIELRRQLSSVVMTPPQPGQEAARKQQLAQLENQEQLLARRVAQAEGGEFHQDPWVDMAAIRREIPANGILVDFARFVVDEMAPKNNKYPMHPARYVAWVIPAEGKGEIQIVDLGEAAVVDRAVTAVQQGMEAAIGSQREPGLIERQGEAEAKSLIDAPLGALSKLVLAPLLQHVGNAHELILCPDAALWLAPWDALPLNDGRYAIEAYNIRYVTSSRNLVQATTGNVSMTKSVIMANPNFDLEPAKIIAASQAVFGKLNQPAKSHLRAISGNRNGLGRVSPLAGTEAEAEAIKQPLAVYAHDVPILYKEDYALEAVFKAIRRPKVLVLSTHGFFMQDQQTKLDDKIGTASPANDQRGAILTVDGEPIENPLLRCGLLLAGCNSRVLIQQGEDGVLTGMEIVGSDLRGTELVVLSACETGLGKVRNGEGVAGLRQAFQLAGAKAVVSTLWRIPDEETATLMSGFFTNLAAGHSKAEALRSAQLAIIKSHGEQTRTAHPFFWAAFTLTGN